MNGAQFVPIRISTICLSTLFSNRYQKGNQNYKSKKIRQCNGEKNTDKLMEQLHLKQYRRINHYIIQSRQVQFLVHSADIQKYLSI